MNTKSVFFDAVSDAVMMVFVLTVFNSGMSTEALAGAFIGFVLGKLLFLQTKTVFTRVLLVERFREQGSSHDK